MPITITRRFEFDAAHRVFGHEGKCRHLHGHRYVAEVTVSAPLDKLGRVIDFSVLKEKVGKWIDENWDHNILLHPNDPLVFVWKHPHHIVGFVDKIRNKDVFGDKEPYIMAEGMNPTAENLAICLFTECIRLLHEHSIKIVHVRVYETPNCFADYPGE